MKVVPFDNNNSDVNNNDIIDNNPLSINQESVKQKLRVYNILKYVKHKFPSFLLFIHMCISKYIFVCSFDYSSTINSTDVIKETIKQ